MNEYILPYDFIQPAKINRDYHFQDSKGDKHGVIEVKLTVKTPMVAVEESKDDKTINRGEHIPASSIKGMLRNAAEIIWNDDISVLDKELVIDKKKVPLEWRNEGTHIRKYGPVSHLFGFSSGTRGEKMERKSDDEYLDNALPAKLSFTNAVVDKSTFNGSQAFRHPFALSTPMGRMKGLQVSYYLTRDKSQAAGRKVYLAGALKDVQKLQYVVNSKGLTKEGEKYFSTRKLNFNAKNRKPESFYTVFPNTVYSFQIHFKYVKEQEIADVVRLLELEPERFHSIGAAKPLGMGRIQLDVVNIKLKTKENLFQLNKESHSELVSKEELLKQFPNRYEQKYNEYIDLLNTDEFEEQKLYPTPRGSIKARPYRFVKENKFRYEPSISQTEKKPVHEPELGKLGKHPTGGKLDNSQQKGQKNSNQSAQAKSHQPVSMDHLKQLQNRFNKR